MDRSNPKATQTTAVKPGETQRKHKLVNVGRKLVGGGEGDRMGGRKMKGGGRESN